jgi:rod shape-determining protein MreC
MTQITSLFPKNWRNLHLTLIVFFSILLIVNAFGINQIISRSLINSLYLPFFNLKNLALQMGTISSENELLRQKLVEANTRVAILEESARENERMRSILGFEPPAGYKLLPAKVVTVDYGGNRPVAAVINKGARDSVAIDQPVVNQQGLVGRIKEVMNDVSLVQLLTDPSNRVAARISDTREMGIVKYRTGEGLILDNFPIQGSIHEGDLIVSSGLGGVYTAGLVIGLVKEIVREPDEPFCEVKLSSAATFSSVEEIFVLRSVSE